MKPTLTGRLASAGLALSLCLCAVPGGMAAADDDDDDDDRRRTVPAITEVLVTFDDPAQDLNDSLRITVQGVDLHGAADVSATLGAQGALEILWADGNEILALCPAPELLCPEGDYR